jgi:hypothetical protein
MARSLDKSTERLANTDEAGERLANTDEAGERLASTDEADERLANADEAGKRLASTDEADESLANTDKSGLDKSVKILAILGKSIEERSGFKESSGLDPSSTVFVLSSLGLDSSEFVLSLLESDMLLNK